ncbi:MAG: FecR domain-containing protein [Pseudomonadota bacterium]
MTERDEKLDELLRGAESRLRVPDTARQSAYRHLGTTWRGLVWRRRAMRAGIAATIVAAIGAALIVFRPETPPAPVVAETVRIIGDAWRVDEGGVAETLPVGASIRAGLLIRVDRQGGVALRDTNGVVLRLDQGTRLRSEGASHWFVEAGAVYIDTQAVAADTRAASGPTVRVESAFGSVVNRGTQFLVAVSTDNMAVAVRRGRVAVSSGSGQVAVEAGQQVDVDEDGPGRTREVAGWGAVWRWTENLVDWSIADGQTVAQLLLWVSHETGHPVAYENESARELALQSRVFGIAGLPPMRALPLGLASAEMRFGLVDGTIVVSKAR